MTCAWWVRWWHRRLRRIDKQVMLSAIALAAADRGEGIDAIADAWELFKADRGQEHWRCACAKADKVSR